MSTFKVKIDGGRVLINTTVVESAHDDTAALAVITALKSYMNQGLSTFPFNDVLTISIERVQWK